MQPSASLHNTDVMDFLAKQMGTSVKMIEDYSHGHIALSAKTLMLHSASGLPGMGHSRPKAAGEMALRRERRRRQSHRKSPRAEASPGEGFADRPEKRRDRRGGAEVVQILQRRGPQMRRLWSAFWKRISPWRPRRQQHYDGENSLNTRSRCFAGRERDYRPWRTVRQLVARFPNQILTAHQRLAILPRAGHIPLHTQ